MLGAFSINLPLCTSSLSFHTQSMLVSLLLNNYFGFSDLAYYGIYGATGLLFGILAVWLEKVFIVIATSLTGSLMFLLGKCPCKRPVTQNGDQIQITILCTTLASYWCFHTKDFLHECEAKDVEVLLFTSLPCMKRVKWVNYSLVFKNGNVWKFLSLVPATWVQLYSRDSSFMNRWDIYH